MAAESLPGPLHLQCSSSSRRGVSPSSITMGSTRAVSRCHSLSASGSPGSTESPTQWATVMAEFTSSLPRPAAATDDVDGHLPVYAMSDEKQVIDFLRETLNRARTISRTLPPVSANLDDDSTLQAETTQCPIHLGPVDANKREAFSCGVHACCFACASKHTKLMVNQGRLPRCIDKACNVETDPLLALRLLESSEDQDRYLQLKLWSNPRVQACPKCRCMLYLDVSLMPGATATCTACSYTFCCDCRCAQHEGVDCAVAMKKHMDRLAQDETLRSVQVLTPRRPCARVADDDELRGASGPSFRGPMRSVSTRNFERAVHQCGFKVCPRCRAGVEKSDDGCDHLTCMQCGHEFCWSCLAPHHVVKAHGNHHHRVGCAFYCAWSGQDDFLPNECERCALRGSVCRPFRSVASRTSLYDVAWDVFGRFFMQNPLLAFCTAVDVS